jgi:hypothetical protein
MVLPTITMQTWNPPHTKQDKLYYAQLFGKNKEKKSGADTRGFKTIAELGLKDGMKVSSNRVLDLAMQFLGKDYKELEPGSGRYVSADGTRVVKMGTSDITGPHVNFETLKPNPAKPGKMKVDKNLHIFLTD